MKPNKEELQQLLDDMKNKCEVFYFANKYGGEGTHYCSDCCYKDECQKGDAFDYLQGLIDNYEST